MTRENEGLTPPQNIDAEKSVLGGILFDNEGMHRALEHLKTGQEFYRPAHKLIYAAFLELSEKGNPIDLMTVSEQLKKSQALEQTDGLDYLGSLMKSVHTAANVGMHARIVKEKYTLRRIIAQISEVHSLCHEQSEDVPDLLDRVEAIMFGITGDGPRGFVPFPDALDDTITHIEKLAEHKGVLSGLSTGFYDLDKMTAGLQRGDLIIVAGRPSMGKTALCINIMEHAAIKEQKEVAFFSLEMSAQQLILRMLSSLSRVDSYRIRGGFTGKEDWKAIVEAVQKLYSAKISIDDSAVQTCLEIRSKARRLKAEKKSLDLIVIDYLGLLSSRGKVENRVREVAEFTKSLKALARELDVPVVVVSQLSRKVEERIDKRPILSDLRDSGDIEQDADIVCFVYREEYYTKDKKPEVMGLAEFIIAKHRNGPTGKVDLVFNSGCTRFDNPAPPNDFK